MLYLVPNKMYSYWIDGHCKRISDSLNYCVFNLAFFIAEHAIWSRCPVNLCTKVRGFLLVPKLSMPSSSDNAILWVPCLLATSHQMWKPSLPRLRLGYKFCTTVRYSELICTVRTLKRNFPGKFPVRNSSPSFLRLSFSELLCNL